ncbi:hypothetical protein Tco_0426240 [Tanacetum coccineum]
MRDAWMSKISKWLSEGCGGLRLLSLLEIGRPEAARNEWTWAILPTFQSWGCWSSSASSSTRNPPRKVAQTSVIEISLNESSPLKKPSNNYNTTPPTTPLKISPQTQLTTPLVTPPLAPQPTTPTTLASRKLVFTTPPTSPHPYLNTLEDLPPKCTNPPPLPTLEQLVSQPLPLPDHMDVEPSLPPTNLTRRNTRLSALLEPNLTRAQIIEELNELHDISNTIDMALQNALNASSNHTTTTTSQIPPLPPLPSHIPPPQTFMPLDKSLWIDEPSSQPPQLEHTYVHCHHTQTLIHEVRDEMRFIFHHILE